MRAALRGIGMWLPPEVRHNDAWGDELVARSRAAGDRTLVDIPEADADLAARVTSRYLADTAADPFIGSSTRYVAPADVSSWAAETEAARIALNDGGVAPSELDVVLSWSIVPDRAAHATAPKVAYELGATRAFGMGVDAGCASALTQLSMASALIEAGRARHVLITQSHLITRAFPMSHPASPGVGDCATAAIVSASERPGVVDVRALSHGEHWDAVTWVRGRDEDTDTPWWLEGGPFFPGSRSPDGAKALMRDTVRFGAETVGMVLSKHGVRPSDVSAFVCVQPRWWTPAAIAEVAGIDVDRAPNTFEEIAHVGGCGVVANLVEARRRGLLDEHSLVALYAQGAGFTRAAALVRWGVS